MHETFVFRGFFDECSRTVAIIYAKVYIMIGLEKTYTAVYICSLKPNRTFGN